MVVQYGGSYHDPQTEQDCFSTLKSRTIAPERGEGGNKVSIFRVHSNVYLGEVGAEC